MPLFAVFALKSKDVNQNVILIAAFSSRFLRSAPTVKFSRLSLDRESHCERYTLSDLCDGAHKVTEYKMCEIGSVYLSTDSHIFCARNPPNKRILYLDLFKQMCDNDSGFPWEVSCVFLHGFSRTEGCFFLLINETDLFFKQWGISYPAHGR